MNELEQRADFIRANLREFCIQDPLVTGKVDITDQDYVCVFRTVTIGPMALSELCARASNLRRSCQCEAGERVSYHIRVFEHDQEIGNINSDNRFCFIQAPDLRVCVGWMVATDLGSETLLHYDLDSEILLLADIILDSAQFFMMDDETGIRSCFVRFIHQLAATTMAYHHGSKFSDGCNGAANTFWRVALRRILGREHPGFPIPG